MRARIRILLICAGVMPVAGCLVPHIRHNNADGWTVEWEPPKLREEEQKSFENSMVDSLWKNGYGYNNEKNFQKAIEQARKQ